MVFQKYLQTKEFFTASTKVNKNMWSCFMDKNHMQYRFSLWHRLHASLLFILSNCVHLCYQQASNYYTYSFMCLPGELWHNQYCIIVSLYSDKGMCITCKATSRWFVSTTREFQTWFSVVFYHEWWTIYWIFQTIKKTSVPVTTSCGSPCLKPYFSSGA